MKKEYKGCKIDKDKKGWYLVFSKELVKDMNLKPNQPVELKIVDKHHFILKLV